MEQSLLLKLPLIGLSQGLPGAQKIIDQETWQEEDKDEEPCENPREDVAGTTADVTDRP
jgi:hypothetical protein